MFLDSLARLPILRSPLRESFRIQYIETKIIGALRLSLLDYCIFGTRLFIDFSYLPLDLLLAQFAVKL